MCGSETSYRHRDFNRYLGIALVVGAGLLDLALETLPLCLVLMSALDLVLFRWLPEVTVCYGCEAILRGAPPGAEVGAFDLEVAERERLASARRVWERLQSEPPAGSRSI
ncbi:MAG: hypothetical protein HY722_06045 [Planctomycetes bacterium]|nr:hypothetical protein [Planctomycetota bacterium]